MNTSLNIKMESSNGPQSFLRIWLINQEVIKYVLLFTIISQNSKFVRFRKWQKNRLQAKWVVSARAKKIKQIKTHSLANENVRIYVFLCEKRTQQRIVTYFTIMVNCIVCMVVSRNFPAIYSTYEFVFLLHMRW